MATSKRFKSENLCTNCGKDVMNLTRLQQDKHEIECKKQQKLF